MEHLRESAVQGFASPVVLKVGKKQLLVISFIMSTYQEN